jgi:UV DNA damage endonuclease
MPLRFGYVSQNYTIEKRTGRGFRLANLTGDRLLDSARANIDDLLDILAWNHRQGIALFRLASGFVPFASHPSCAVPWEELLREDFGAVGATLRRTGIRISTHPGQYTVLTSPQAEVVRASLAELEYHGRLMDLLGAGTDARILLHLGGIHEGKVSSLSRFIRHARELSPSVLERLTLEGDERLYTVSDALAVARELGVTVVVDTLHHRLNPDGLTLGQALQEARKTWKPMHGPQKVHLSSQNPTLQRGAHDDYIHPEDFQELLDALPGELDVMVEAKAKDKAVLSLLDDTKRLLDVG